MYMIAYYSISVLQEAPFEAGYSTFLLKVEETSELWPEESARAGTPVTCHDHVEPMQCIRTPDHMVPKVC